MRHQATRQSGFSLIEFTVASAIFSMGLAGVSLMLMTAITGTAEAGHQTIATSTASSLAELIALSTDAADHYVDPLPFQANACLDHAECTEEQWAAHEMGLWQQALTTELPNGTGLVCRDSTPDDGHEGDEACDGNGSLVVKVFWQELYRLNVNDDGRRRLVTRVPY